MSLKLSPLMILDISVHVCRERFSAGIVHRGRAVPGWSAVLLVWANLMSKQWMKMRHCDLPGSLGLSHASLQRMIHKA